MFAYILQFITLKRTNVLKREAHSKFMRHLLCKNELGSPCFLVEYLCRMYEFTPGVWLRFIIGLFVVKSHATQKRREKLQIDTLSK